MTNDLAGTGAAVSLRILDLAGQCADKVTGEVSAVGRGQRSVLLALEVIVQDQFLMVLGKDQINTGPLEFSVEEQMRIRHDDRARRDMGSPNRLDVVVEMLAAVSGKLRFECTSVIQRATAMVNEYIISII
jgi:hypothetical protein